MISLLSTSILNNQLPKMEMLKEKNLIIKYSNNNLMIGWMED